MLLCRMKCRKHDSRATRRLNAVVTLLDAQYKHDEPT